MTGTPRATRVRRVRRFATAMYILLGLLLVGIIGVAIAALLRAPQQAAIEVDTTEPGLLVVAENVQSALAAKGFSAQIYDNGEYDIIVEKVQDTNDARGITIGVTGRSVSAKQFPNVESLGVVADLPLLIVARGEPGSFTSPAELVGKRIQIGDEATVTWDVAERLLAEYGVNEANTTFQRDKVSVAHAKLRDGRSDAVFTLYSDSDLDLRREMESTGYSLVPITAARALAGRLGDVTEGVLPQGSFGILQDLPPADVPVIEIPINVVAHDDTSPSAIFAIAEALKQEYGGGSVLAEPGQFPAQSANLPNSPESTEYYQNSSVPWQYRVLPPSLADLFLPLALAGTIFLIAASVYQLLLPEAYSLWTGILRPRRQRKRSTAVPGEATETSDGE